MSCNINSNIALDCIDGAGSVVKALVLNGPADSFTETVDGVVDGITIGGSAVTSADWFEWSLPRQTSSYSENATISVENATLFFDKNLALFFNKMDAAKRNEFLLAAQNQQMIVAFTDANGTSWVFGLQKGAYTSAANAVTGSDFASRNGYEITLSSQETEPAYVLDPALVP